MANSTSLSLTCSIEVQDEYRLGEPIMVNCRLQNNGDKDAWVLRWNTFLEGARGDFVRLSLGGSPIPYDGIYARRGAPTAESYVQIPPGGFVAAAIDLSTAYPIRTAGDYQVSLELRLHDAFDSGEPPRPMQAHQQVVLSSNATVLHVVEFGPPLPTKGERLRAQSPGTKKAVTTTGAYPNSPTKPTINGANKSETKAIIAAHNWAYGSVLKSLAGIPSSMYATWFGTAPQSTVTGIYNDIAAAMSSSQPIIYQLGDQEECNWDVYAWTYLAGPSQITIYICDLFFSLFILPTSADDQAETVVHEMAHAAGGVDDKTYGEWSCQMLALTNPTDAADNADNYGYCAIEVLPEGPGDDNGVWTGDSRFHDSTTVRPAAAGSAVGGTIMMIYQDTNTDVPKLWFRTCTVPNTWTNSANIPNSSTKIGLCLTAVGPSLAVANGNYYCVYVDGDSTSTTYQQLICINTTNKEATTWTQPSVVINSNVTMMSPALTCWANSDGTSSLYCVYVDSNSNLNVVVGTVALDGSLTWGAPTQMGPAGTPYQSSVEPALGVYLGQIFCMYADLTTGALKYVTTSPGAAWSTESELSDSHTSSGVALSAWDAPQSQVLMCLYRGMSGDNHLRYIMYDDSQSPGIWTEEYIVAGDWSSNGPAIATPTGSTLYAFYKGATNENLYWASTESQYQQTAHS